MTFTLYALVDPRAPEVVRYIGLTQHQPELRLRGHVKDACSTRHSHKLDWIRSLLKSAVHPQIRVLEIVSTREEAVNRECELIRTHRQEGHSLTNTTIGGDGWGAPHSLITKALLKERAHQQFSSPEARLKASISAKHRMTDAEERNKISQALKGRVIPLETRKKMSLGQLKRWAHEREMGIAPYLIQLEQNYLSRLKYAHARAYVIKMADSYLKRSIRSESSRDLQTHTSAYHSRLRDDGS